MAYTVCGKLQGKQIITDDVPSFTDKEYTWNPTPNNNGSNWKDLLSTESETYSYGCMTCTGNNGQTYAHAELYGCSLTSDSLGCLETEYFNGSKCTTCPNQYTKASDTPGHTNSTCDWGCERYPDGGDGIYQTLVGTGNSAHCEQMPHGCDNPYHYDEENKTICEWGYRDVSDRVGFPLCLLAPDLTASQHLSPGETWPGGHTGSYKVYSIQNGLFSWYCPPDTYLAIQGLAPNGRATGRERAICMPCPNGGWRRPRNPFKDSLADCTVLSGSNETGTYEYNNISKPNDDITNYVGDKDWAYGCLYHSSNWTCSYLYCSQNFTWSTWSGTYDDNNPEACYAE